MYSSDNADKTGGAVIELSTCTWAFWHKTGAEYRLENPRESGSKGGRTREALGNKITWLCAIFLLGYVGAEGQSAISTQPFNSKRKQHIQKNPVS